MKNRKLQLPTMAEFKRAYGIASGALLSLALIALTIWLMSRMPPNKIVIPEITIKSWVVNPVVVIVLMVAGAFASFLATMNTVLSILEWQLEIKIKKGLRNKAQLKEEMKITPKERLR